MSRLLKDPLFDARQIAGWLDHAAPETWWTLMALFTRTIALDPVLQLVFDQVDLADADLYITAERPLPPADIEYWAKCAWATNLHAILAQAQGNTEGFVRHHLGYMRAMSCMQHREDWVNGERERLNMVFIRPILAVLEREVTGTALFHAAIERWVNRVRWFGLAAVRQGEDIKEAALQDDLHRFLFDAGYDPADREVQSARGWIDFRVLGADAKRVPVELKRWRGPADDSHVRAGLPQLLRYLADQQAAFGYLVVGDVSATHRLNMRDGVEVDGRAVRLLVAEVRPPAPTVDPREDHHIQLP